MKKFTVGLAILLMGFLAACGNSENAEEVYQKAVEAGENMESVEMDMVINQTIESDAMEGAMEMEMDTQSSMTIDPLAMHQTGTVNMEMEGMPIETEMEMYLTDTDFYMYESMSQTWLKMSADMMPTEMMNTDQTAQDQLEMLESFIDDIEFVEEDDYYAFKFDGEGEEFAALTEELIKENLGEETFADLGVEISEILEEMTIHSMYYEIHIDKETYDTTKVMTNMDFDMNAEGESLRMNQEMTATYTGINTVDEIVVPQEVIDAAQEM